MCDCTAGYQHGECIECGELIEAETPADLVAAGDEPWDYCAN